MNIQRITPPAPTPDTPPASPMLARRSTPAELPEWPLPIAHTLVMPPANASMSRTPEAHYATPGATIRLLIAEEGDYWCRAALLSATCLPITGCCTAASAFGMIEATAASSVSAAASGNATSLACAGWATLSSCAFAASLTTTGLVACSTAAAVTATYRRRNFMQQAARPAAHNAPPAARPAEPPRIVIQQPDGSVGLGQALPR